jgi:uncharacterized protein DUF6985
MMTTGDNIQEDAVFGTLKRDANGLFWEGAYLSRTLGRIRLRVQSDGLVSDAQRGEFALFKKNEGQIFNDAQEYVFEAYKRFLEAIENDPFQGPEDFVQLKNSKQIWAHLNKPFDGGTSLIVQYSRERTVVLRLAWNCDWDAEHGTSVCIENGRVVDHTRWLELE